LGRGDRPVTKLFSSLKQALIGQFIADSSGAPVVRIRVRCGKCGEIISTRVDKAYELQCEYSDLDTGDSEIAPPPTGYVLQKEVVGRNCQNLVHFMVRFDARRRMTRHEISGGEFLGCEEVN